jgi:hypothetical protein
MCRIKCVPKQGRKAASVSTPWSGIVSALVHECGCEAANRAARREGAVATGDHPSAVEGRVGRSRSYPPETATTNALVRVLERQSENAVVILWQDATRCHYGDQVWVRCRSAKTGICALSGNAIRRGDPIYRPRQRQYLPANAQAMILASAIEVGAGDWTEDQR